MFTYGATFRHATYTKKKLTDEELTWFYIASEIGSTVNEAKQRVSYSEYCDWLLFFKTNPPMRQHINNIGALIGNTVYNCAQGTKKRLKFKDFLIDYQDLTMTDEERLKKSFEQYELNNPTNFKVNNG